MSLTTDIANLTSEVTDLTSRVATWIDQADAKIDQALATVPKLRIGFHVDPANGSDTNDGRTAATAFATLDRALDEVNANSVKWIDILLYGNVTASGTRQLRANTVMIRAADLSQRPIVDLDATGNLILWSAFLRYQSVHIRLAPNAPADWKFHWPAGFASVVFRDCTVEHQGAGYFCARGYGGLALSGYGITAINMAGKWVQEAPAGTDIDAVPGVISDIPNT